MFIRRPINGHLLIHSPLERMDEIKTIFLIFGILYLSGAVIRQDLAAILLMIAYVAAFILGWSSTNKSIRVSANNFPLIATSHASKAAYMYCCICLVILLSLAAYFIMEFGLDRFFFVSRSARALVTREFLFLSIFDDVAVGLFWFMSAIIVFQRRSPGKVYYAICTILLLYAAISISLAMVVSIAIPLYMLYNTKYNLNSMLWFIALVGMIVTVAWKPVIGSLVLGYDEISYSDFRYPAELTAWVDIFSSLTAVATNSELSNTLYGMSYVDTIIGTILPFFEVEPLSVQYAKNFIGDIYLQGGGRGFSFPLEAYLNFGPVGPIVIGFVSGLSLRIISNNSSRTILSYFLYIAFTATIFKFFRSESYSLVKNLFWLQIFPVLCISLFTVFTISIFKKNTQRHV